MPSIPKITASSVQITEFPDDRRANIQKLSHNNVMETNMALDGLIFVNRIIKYTINAKIIPHNVSVIINASRL